MYLVANLSGSSRGPYSLVGRRSFSTHRWIGTSTVLGDVAGSVGASSIDTGGMDEGTDALDIGGAGGASCASTASAISACDVHPCYRELLRGNRFDTPFFPEKNAGEMQFRIWISVAKVRRVLKLDFKIVFHLHQPWYSYSRLKTRSKIPVDALFSKEAVCTQGVAFSGTFRKRGMETWTPLHGNKPNQSPWIKGLHVGHGAIMETR